MYLFSSLTVSNMCADPEPIIELPNHQVSNGLSCEFKFKKFLDHNGDFKSIEDRRIEAESKGEDLPTLVAAFYEFLEDPIWIDYQEQADFSNCYKDIADIYEDLTIKNLNSIGSQPSRTGSKRILQWLKTQRPPILIQNENSTNWTEPQTNRPEENPFEVYELVEEYNPESPLKTIEPVASDQEFPISAPNYQTEPIRDQDSPIHTPQRRWGSFRKLRDYSPDYRKRPRSTVIDVERELEHQAIINFTKPVKRSTSSEISKRKRYSPKKWVQEFKLIRGYQETPLVSEIKLLNIAERSQNNHEEVQKTEKSHKISHERLVHRNSSGLGRRKSLLKFFGLTGWLADNDEEKENRNPCSGYQPCSGVRGEMYSPSWYSRSELEEGSACTNTDRVSGSAYSPTQLETLLDQLESNTTEEDPFLYKTGKLCNEEELFLGPVSEAEQVSSEESLTSFAAEPFI